MASKDHGSRYLCRRGHFRISSLWLMITRAKLSIVSSKSLEQSTERARSRRGMGRGFDALASCEASRPVLSRPLTPLH
jgi:hypothetical protein